MNPLGKDQKCWPADLDPLGLLRVGEEYPVIYKLRLYRFLVVWAVNLMYYGRIPAAEAFGFGFKASGQLYGHLPKFGLERLPTKAYEPCHARVVVTATVAGIGCMPLSHLWCVLLTQEGLSSTCSGISKAFAPKLPL